MGRHIDHMLLLKDQGILQHSLAFHSSFWQHDWSSWLISLWGENDSKKYKSSLMTNFFLFNPLKLSVADLLKILPQIFGGRRWQGGPQLVGSQEIPSSIKRTPSFFSSTKPKKSSASISSYKVSTKKF